MNWFVIGGVLLHILRHAPAAVELVEQLFNILRSENKAPTDVWRAVTEKIETTKSA